MELNEVFDYQTRIQNKTGEKIDGINILIAKNMFQKNMLNPFLNICLIVKEK